MADEECECPEPPRGLPAYLATFADLMSLLMCFFVLLLSFSEMDVQKYKQVAGSMKNAFGVQNEIKVKDIPKGTSIIAQEFSPGRPQPTPLNEVRQNTTASMEDTLDVRCAPGTNEAREAAQEKAKEAAIMERLVKMTEADAVDVAAELKADITNGSVEVETRNRRIVIRVKEQGSFPSGSATLRQSFLPIMAKIQDAMKGIPGDYSVEGHTDDVPISTARFRSNWELSSARAVSVAQELLKGGELDPKKFVIKGYGDVRPLVPNDTAAHRARNRRVEIVIEQGNDDAAYLSGKKALPPDPEFTPDLLQKAGLGNVQGFQIIDSAHPETAESAPAAGTAATPPGEVPPAADAVQDTVPDMTQPAPQPTQEPGKAGLPAPQSSDMTVDPFVAPEQTRKQTDDEFF